MGIANIKDKKLRQGIIDNWEFFTEMSEKLITIQEELGGPRVLFEYVTGLMLAQDVTEDELVEWVKFNYQLAKDCGVMEEGDN